MVPGRPGYPAAPDLNPQSYDIGCSKGPAWGCEGWLGHFQEGQKGQNQLQGAQEGHLSDWHNFSVVDLPLVKSIGGLSVVGLQSFHGILAQNLKIWGGR